MRTTIPFDSLEEMISCYGRENVIPIDCLSQIIFYVKHGCQPKFIWPKEGNSGHITGWFLKSETEFLYRKWKENRPGKSNTK